MELSLFSVSYAGLWGQERLDIEAFIAKAAALGYSAVMLMGKRPHLSPLDTDDERLKSIAACLEQHRVRCAAVAAYTDFSPQRAAEVPFGEMQFDYVRSLCRFAAALEAPCGARLHGLRRSAAAPTTAWNTVVGSLRQCAEIAADFGITLAVQNHHDLAVDSGALAELLCDVDRSNLKLAFDAWSPALRGEDLFDAAKRSGPLHGHHHQCRLRPLAAISLPQRIGQLRTAGAGHGASSSVR